MTRSRCDEVHTHASYNLKQYRLYKCHLRLPASPLSRDHNLHYHVILLHLTFWYHASLIFIIVACFSFFELQSTLECGSVSTEVLKNRKWKNEHRKWSVRCTVCKVLPWLKWSRYLWVASFFRCEASCSVTNCVFHKYSNWIFFVPAWSFRTCYPHSGPIFISFLKAVI